MKILRHTITVLLVLLLLAGVPVYATGYVQKMLSDKDTVSSATTIIEQPSGAYVVLINRDKHPSAENLAVWESFFSGEEIDYLFEDITCLVALEDSVGLELAASMQSRLPENQMKIEQEEAFIMLSKIDYGRYDVMLFSRDFYDLLGMDSSFLSDTDDLIEAEGV